MNDSDENAPRVLSRNWRPQFTRTATNRPYDPFTLRKRPGRAHQLIELLLPERRRTPAEKAAVTQ